MNKLERKYVDFYTSMSIRLQRARKRNKSDWVVQRTLELMRKKID